MRDSKIILYIGKFLRLTGCLSINGIGVLMEKINIICVDDEHDVLDSLCRDLAFFSDLFTIEKCESALECLALLEDIYLEKKSLALVISDHVMPGKTGVELLTEIEMDSRFTGTKTLLLTDLVTEPKTRLLTDLVAEPNVVQASNQAKLDYFLEKACNSDTLLLTVKELVTEFIIEQDIEYKGYIKTLDAKTLERLLKNE